MSPKLPFVVQPRLSPIIEEIGTDESGKIQVERRGYLTSGEKAFFQQIQQVNGGGQELIKLSRSICSKYNVEMKAAYDALVAIISNQSKTKLSKQIEGEYADEIQEVINALAISQTREELVMATCLLYYRVNPEFTAEETSKLHPDIISGLAQLYRDEDAKSIDKLEKGMVKDESTLADELEKKP